MSNHDTGALSTSETSGSRQPFDKVEAEGWIRSRIKPEDNRVQLVLLTAAGRRVIPELAEIADHDDDLFFAFLDARERDPLRDLLIKFADHQIRDVPSDDAESSMQEFTKETIS